MKKSMTMVWTLVLAILITAQCFSQDSTTAFDSLLVQRFPATAPGASVLVVKDGKPVYRKAFGKANLELDVAMKPEQIFAIGSITKQFTACAILKLAEEGKLSLQDSITKFIPDYPTHGHTISLEHLLTHSSGIKSITEMKQWTGAVQKKDFTPKELIDFIKNEPMDFAPGEQFHYSNSGYIILGYVIEQVSGKNYGDYIHDTFFTPLSLTKTSYSNHSRVIPNRAAGYQKDKGYYENADYLSVTQPYAAGSILSTVDDLHRWYEAVMIGKVVSAQSLQKAHTPYRLKNGTLAPYGYGWRLGNVQGSPSVKHGGQVNGYASFSLYLPQEKVFVAVFTNCDSNNDLQEISSQLAAMVIGKPYTWNRIELTPDELAAYNGVYESGPTSQQIVSYEGGRLVVYLPKRKKEELMPYAKDKFRLEQSLINFEFKRNDSGKIVSLTEVSTSFPVTNVRTSKPVTQRKAIPVAPKTLQAYVGSYQFNPGVLFVVSQEANKLYGKLSGPNQTKQEIIPYEQHKFFARNVDATVEFELDQDGKVTGLSLQQNDKKSATKVE